MAPIQSFFPSPDPRTWPFFTDIWVAIGLYSLVIPALWSRYKRHRIAAWPATIGKIESTAFDERSRRRRGYRTLLEYSYSVHSATCHAAHEQYFRTLDDAEEFVRDLEGKPVSVNYNPNKPSSSGLTRNSINLLTSARAPKPLEPSPNDRWARAIPASLRPYMWILVALSAMGFLLSFLANLGALLGALHGFHSFSGVILVTLHLGCMLIAIPAGLITSKRGLRSGDIRHMLKHSPKWMGYLTYLFTAYAFITFGFAFFNAPSHLGGNLSDTAGWCMFSAFWMSFYWSSFVVLYFAARADLIARRNCLQGHPMPPGAAVCPTCGQARYPSIVTPSRSLFP